MTIVAIPKCGTGSEWQLQPGETPPLGAHVVVARRGYTHHGIHVGDGTIVHYSGFSRQWTGGPVEAVPLSHFAQRHAVSVRVYANPRFDGREVGARARSRIAENAYGLFTNNCEHFCEWCVLGRSRSRQVEQLLNGPRHAWTTAARTLKRRVREWFTVDPGHGGSPA
jgi:lecithin:retinol acyltransferase